MATDPPELPLPPNFGKGGDNVIHFGKWPKPVKGFIPELPPMVLSVGLGIHCYHLTDEELIELRSYLSSKPRLKELKVPPVPLDDSPLAMLKDLVHHIEAGHIHPVAALVVTVEIAPQDGGEIYPFYVSQLNRLAVVGMLHELLENLP